MNEAQSKWNDFEHRIWKVMVANGLDQKKSYLLAISGGVDSMVLLSAISRLKPQSQIRVCHFHHGPSQDQQQLNYRDQVFDFVKHKISDMNSQRNLQAKIEIIVDRSDRELLSEADMREARWQFLNRSRSHSAEPILTGHHLDDWLETAVLKMMRGTSMQGVAAFQVWNSEIFRPFLHVSKSDLIHYAKALDIEYLEDPSNQSFEYLRNWVREKWLPELEDRQPGSVANMARSLLEMVTEYEESSTFKLMYFDNNQDLGLDRMWYFALSQQEQLKALALFLKSNRIFDFSRGHLEEIRKRLDKNQKDLTFEIIGRKWVINASQIMLK